MQWFLGQLPAPKLTYYMTPVVIRTFHTCCHGHQWCWQTLSVLILHIYINTQNGGWLGGCLSSIIGKAPHIMQKTLIPTSNGGKYCFSPLLFPLFFLHINKINFMFPMTSLYVCFFGLKQANKPLESLCSCSLPTENS